MKKTILKTNCFIIAIAIMLQMIGNPTTTYARWHSQAPQQKSSTGTWILLGAASAILITVAIMAISKKKKRQHAYLYQQMDYSKLNYLLPLDYKLAAKQKGKAGPNGFTKHFLKNNSWVSPLTKNNLKINLAGFAYGKKWDADFNKPIQQPITSNEGINGHNF